MKSEQIIGVTVGVGSPYAELASLSSACFSDHTGIPSVILGEKEFSDSGLAHPAALRLKLFNYVNAEAVVYFDADWFCLQRWDPREVGSGSEICACRDFILTNEWPHQQYDFDSACFNECPIDVPVDPDLDVLRWDYIREIVAFADLRLPLGQWINSGLVVISREHHRKWLEVALELYQGKVGHHRVYYEQPALLKALETLKLGACLLPRRLNVLAAHAQKWPQAVIGLHVKAKRHHDLLVKIRDRSISNPRQLVNHFVNED